MKNFNVFAAAFSALFFSFLFCGILTAGKAAAKTVSKNRAGAPLRPPALDSLARGFRLPPKDINNPTHAIVYKEGGEACFIDVVQSPNVLPRHMRPARKRSKIGKMPFPPCDKDTAELLTAAAPKLKKQEDKEAAWLPLALAAGSAAARSAPWLARFFPRWINYLKNSGQTLKMQGSVFQARASSAVQSRIASAKSRAAAAAAAAKKQAAVLKPRAAAIAAGRAGLGIKTAGLLTCAASVAASSPTLFDLIASLGLDIQTGLYLFKAGKMPFYFKSMGLCFVAGLAHNTGTFIAVEYIHYYYYYYKYYYSD